MWPFGRRPEDRISKGFLVYLLAGYVLLQFVWWAFMLVDLNSEIYQLKLQLLSNSELPSTEHQILKLELDRKLSTRIWMVLGEGSVFVLLLVLGFNSVKGSIAKELKLAEQQKNFLLSITHELKSPLAAIKLQLQTLLSRNLDEAKRSQLYERALNDTNRLEKLVENLLLVNKVESGKVPITKERSDLSKLILDLVHQSYRTELDQDRLSLSLDENVQVNGDPMALQSILSNLLDNAFKYGGGTPVSVSLNAADDIKLMVSDSGPGIADQDKELVFQRFYRLGSEATRTAKGTGIGLYLVRLLVQMHDGKIEVSDNKPSGCSFMVSFPELKH